MNKIYSLLGIGLLSAATLSSCKEDVFIEGGDELQRGESQTYVAVASIRGMKTRTKNRLHVPTYKMTVVPLCGMPMIRLHFGMEQMAMISQP